MLHSLYPSNRLVILFPKNGFSLPCLLNHSLSKMFSGECTPIHTHPSLPSTLEIHRFSLWKVCYFRLMSRPGLQLLNSFLHQQLSTLNNNKLNTYFKSYFIKQLNRSTHTELLQMISQLTSWRERSSRTENHFCLVSSSFKFWIVSLI